MKKIRFGKDIVILWQVLTDGEHTALGCRDLKLEIRNSLNRVVVLPMQVSDTSCVLKAIYHGKDHSSLGRHTLTLIENYGQCDQRIIDAPQVFALVKSTAEEDADVKKNTYDLHMGEITVGECDAPPSADVPVGDVWDEDNILEQEIRVIHNLREINNYGNVLSVPQDVTGAIATNVDLDSLRNEMIEGLRDEATQRMTADSSLGNRITAVVATANNNTISINTLETKLNANLANLRAKDAELDAAISNEATSRRNEVDSLQTSISNVGKRVSTTESKIISLQGNVSTLQSEVTNVKNDVVPKAVAEGIAEVVANAPEDLDTLKEIADYIASDKTNAAEIETSISNLNNKDKAHDDELQLIGNRVTTAEDKIIGLQGSVTNNTNSISANTKALANLSEALEKLKVQSDEDLVKTTWAELKALRDEAKLNAGTFYRITDYVTTTTQSETKSANHPFDVIVLALSENTLCEDAKAILHEGDTYFADSDLSAWKLKYCLDNDKTRFEWADEANGKGVIYRMVDEKRNDCPYDFKNILFYNTKLTSGTTSDRYYYTFSYVISGVLYDGTTEKQVKNCYGNVMGEYRSSRVLQLNKNVFRNIFFESSCSSNTFGSSCSYNTFGNYCTYNTFGDYCSSNTFGNYCSSNTFGDSCRYNTFGYNCTYNTFGDSCSSNTFGDSCTYNTFGNSCTSNTFGSNCSSNTFGNSCYSNTFGSSCSYNTFGNYCSSNTFGDSCTYNTFGDYCSSNTFGYNCYSNTFGYNCTYNTFWDYCYSNTFGDSCTYNTFGDYCYSNTFGNSLQNRSLDFQQTSITLNEEFYDDGSGQLVPTKHPDLSTQPSILPYKFMGQYVYEQLIPKSILNIQDTSVAMILNIYNVIVVEKPIFLEAWYIGSNGALKQAEIEKYEGDDTYYFINSLSNTKYLRIVYTSMPKDSSYYGY